ncbi:YcxB family protein [Shewanella eurypsychrophilus]|uniref:YcxB family protein n=1 Tax=Shewanella eurypsychrophilus TaxID=2593656 RepID=A0ABX6V2M1_9GAMM|nr:MULTISPECIES: YcxB family protein [Shewanella]QFU21565.1 YcxB family protein [Shewanella sp. YLB-09]QPG56855.1 YcxB family protein [Shewanella eurypsychrophilus]
MTVPFSFKTEYLLDKAHFSECFDESVTLDTSLKAYTKAIGFFFIGVALLLTGMNAFASFFVIGLGVLEALNIKFKKTWWLWRQMMSKAAGNNVTLTVDEQGISTDSFYVKSEILWCDVSEIKSTQRGFLIKHSGTSYISKQVLNEEAISFITSKI